MSVRRFLLVPELIRASMRSPRSQAEAWERYWSGVRSTGPDGDVLWDVAERAELDWCLAKAEQHFDPALPVVDIGCGNGRFTRLLGSSFPAAIGVDVASSAVRLAAAGGNVSYRALDATDPAAMRELAPANVFIRGVLHINTPAARARIAEGIAAVLGERGRLLLVETAFEGDPLQYIEYVGGRHGRIPALVRPLVRAGVRAPRRFARPELDRTFPPDAWPRLDSGPADIRAIDQDGEMPSLSIPGFFAALRHQMVAPAGGPQ